MRTKQLSKAARVIWVCACVRYWPYRGVGSVCFPAENWFVSRSYAAVFMEGGGGKRGVITLITAAWSFPSLQLFQLRLISRTDSRILAAFSFAVLFSLFFTLKTVSRSESLFRYLVLKGLLYMQAQHSPYRVNAASPEAASILLRMQMTTILAANRQSSLQLETFFVNKLLL